MDDFTLHPISYRNCRQCFNAGSEQDSKKNNHRMRIWRNKKKKLANGRKRKIRQHSPEIENMKTIKYMKFW